MIKPDIILSWPNSVDYPLFRQFLHENRSRFNKVIIVFTETNQPPNLQEQLQNVMLADDIVFITSPQVLGHEDWRNVAVNEGLKYSDSEWVWFTEQDFIIKNEEKFWDQFKVAQVGGFNLAVVKQEKRIHPCCIFMKRSYLDSLNKDFSAKPPEYDHFGAIQKQIYPLEGLYVFSEDTYLHLNGLSHNWRLVQNGEQPNYRPEQFKMWVTESYRVKPHIDSWKRTARKYLGLSYD